MVFCNIVQAMLSYYGYGKRVPCDLIHHNTKQLDTPVYTDVKLSWQWTDDLFIVLLQTLADC